MLCNKNYPLPHTRTRTQLSFLVEVSSNAAIINTRTRTQLSFLVEVSSNAAIIMYIIIIIYLSMQMLHKCTRWCVSFHNTYSDTWTILGTVVCTDRTRGGDTPHIRTTHKVSSFWSNEYFVTFPRSMHIVCVFYVSYVCVCVCVCMLYYDISIGEIIINTHPQM